MAETKRRAYTPVRISDDGLRRIRKLADQETEGNLSAMIRKLLAEAILARDVTAARRLHR